MIDQQETLQGSAGMGNHDNLQSWKGKYSFKSFFEIFFNVF